MIWFVPPLVTLLENGHPWRVQGSLGSLAVGFAVLMGVMYSQHGWSDQFRAGATASALYSGLVLVFIPVPVTNCAFLLNKKHNL